MKLFLISIVCYSNKTGLKLTSYYVPLLSGNTTVLEHALQSLGSRQSSASSRIPGRAELKVNHAHEERDNDKTAIEDVKGFV